MRGRRPQPAGIAADVERMTERSDGDVVRAQPERLTFDAETGRLQLGASVRVIGASGGNRSVLVAFVELVGATRGVRPAGLFEVRESDLDALSTALDLDGGDLRELLESVLGLSATGSTKLLERLRQRRFLIGVAAAAVAGVVAIGGLSGAAAGSDTPSAPPAAIAGPSVTSDDRVDVGQPDVDGPLVVDEHGVGLIPPLEVGADGTGLIPAAQVDRPEAAQD